jgi:hypothetical protein
VVPASDDEDHQHDQGRGIVGSAWAIGTACPTCVLSQCGFISGPEHFVTEYVMSGTTQGNQFAIAGADVFTMRGGLVGRKDTYLDWLAYQRQVGVDPAATFKELQR